MTTDELIAKLVGRVSSRAIYGETRRRVSRQVALQVDEMAEQVERALQSVSALVALLAEIDAEEPRQA